MKVLLTGATGFLGRRLATLLAGRHELYCVVRSDGTELPPGVTPVVQDLAVGLSRAGVPERIDAVCHVAQSPLYRDFPEAADAVFRVNVAATHVLLDYARAAGASRFLLASTGSVYEPYAGVLAEDAAIAPKSYYPATKLAAEALVRSYEGLFAAASLRLFCLYGRGQTIRLIPALADRFAGGRAVTLAGPDGLVQTPTHVDDAAAVFAAALEERWTGTYNAASPQPVSLRQLATLIGRRLGREARFEQAGEGPAPRLVPELDRLGAKYDLARFRSIEAGLADTFP
jgi:nucleoside-diphosphate-sugar epimerase